MPARPRQGRIAIHVFGIDDCAGVKKKLNGVFRTEGSSAMERRLSLRSTVAHESVGFSVRPGHTIRICAIRQENFHDEVVDRTVGFTQRQVQWRLAGGGLRMIYVGPVGDQELAQLPVTMK